MRLASGVVLKRLTAKLSGSLARLLSMESAASGRIAVCQMTSVGDKAENMRVVTGLVEQAARENVQMVFFPEACDYISDNKKELVCHAEPILGGPTVDSYRRLAADHNVWLSMGGLHEKDPENPTKVYNTHVIIDNEGRVVQTYRKIHLFDVEIPEKNVRLKESDTALPGQHIVTPVKSPVGLWRYVCMPGRSNIGLGICYDLRFPELSTQLANMGAEILTYPSAFTYETGKAHWEVLLRARAIENQCYVVAAAQVGHHNAKRRSYGHTLCVDPWGAVVAACGEDRAYAVADVRLDRLRETRRSMPVFQHRRGDVYSLYALSLRSAPLPEHTEPAPEPCAAREPPRPCGGPTRQFGQVRVPEMAVFYETPLTFAFVNLRCVVPGHVLVAPRRPAARSADLTSEEAADLFATIILVQKLMERVHDATSTTINIQDGPDAGQTIWHLHSHVMPRKPKDFKDNDLIYLELAKHDRISPSAPLKPARSLQEMDAEAAMLREELRKMQAEMACC